MTEPVAGNGRATIREVHVLLGEVRAEVATVDAKIDLLAALPRSNATRLSVMETVCGDRPKLCAMEMEKVIREIVEKRTDAGWTQLQRWGWVVAVVAALASSVIGWMS